MRTEKKGEKKKQMNKDLTVGRPERVLWMFCLPLFGSIIFQQLYNIADSLVAGKFIGENALAAVGNSYEITLIFIAFAFGCNIGCSVIVSQLFGAKRLADVKTAVYTTMIASGILCAILMLAGILSCQALLLLIRTPQEIMADSKLYLDVYIWGLPFLLFYNIATGIFSALGDSKTPFIFHMGVAGVAWATFLCQGISAVLAIAVVLKRLAKIRTEKKAALFSWKILGRIVRIAVPSILQQSFISFGNIIIQTVINGYGPSVIAGYAAAVKLNNLVITSFTTIGNGISNYTAQNLGAGKQERIRQGFFAGLKMIWTICVPMIVLYFLAGRWLLYLFMDQPTDTAMHTGILFLRILSPFYLIVSAKLVADGILRGTGLMKQFMMTTFTDLLLRVALAVLLSRAFGVTGIWCAWPVGWSIATILSLLFYRRGDWERENV